MAFTAQIEFDVFSDDHGVGLKNSLVPAGIEGDHGCADEVFGA